MSLDSGRTVQRVPPAASLFADPQECWLHISLEGFKDLVKPDLSIFRHISTCSVKKKPPCAPAITTECHLCPELRSLPSQPAAAFKASRAMWQPTWSAC